MFIVHAIVNVNVPLLLPLLGALTWVRHLSGNGRALRSLALLNKFILEEFLHVWAGCDVCPVSFVHLSTVISTH